MDTDAPSDGVKNAETGYRVHYTSVDSPSYPSDYQVGADVGANAESYTDTTVQPASTYRYHIRAYTDHTSVTSAPTSVSTPKVAGTHVDDASPDGYHVEVEADVGTVRTPTVIETPQPTPKLNDYPRIQLPVRRDESWQADKWDEARLRVWRDGTRLPIDTLERPEMQPDRTLLHGFGGRQLDQYVER